jgi:catechol 2,3-dioxygenase-like lactoylglutathione lyase family enzyme
MSVERIDHVQLPFAGPLQAQLRHFYGRLLGLSEVRLDATPTLRFAAGTQRIDLAPSDLLHARLTAPGHLALRVRNLPGLRANLLDAGLAIDETHPLPGHWRLYVDDPAGNTVELLEPAHEPGAHA